MSTFSGTYSTTMSNGILVTAGESPSPSGVPKGLIATRSVQLKDGWVGQVTVAEEIVWESEPFEDAEGDSGARIAEREATEFVITRIKGLLS